MKYRITLLLLIGTAYIAHGQITDSTYKSKILELINIQSSQNVIMDEMKNKVLFNMPEDKQDDFKKDMNTIMDKMMNNMVDIYMDVYIREEVDALLDFYDTPEGRHIRDKMPELLKKTMKSGQEYSMELMPLIQKYLH